MGERRPDWRDVFNVTMDKNMMTHSNLEEKERKEFKIVLGWRVD